MGSLELGVTSSNRKSFDSAYANLEATVRNFSRDKMSYEDSIKKLKADLEGKDLALKKNAVIIESLYAENDNLMSAHDEDEAARAAMDAVMCTVNMKQDLLVKAVQDFDSLQRQILDRNAAAETVIDSLKLNHGKLTSKLISTEKDLLKETIQSKDLQNQLQNSKTQCKEWEQKYQAEHRTTEDLLEKLEKVTHQLQGCNLEFQQERDLNTKLQDMLIGTKSEMECKEKVFREKEEQFISLQETLQHQIDDTKGKLDEANQHLECSTKELKEERELTNKLQEMLISVKGELEVKEQVVRDTEEQLKSVRESLQQEITDTKAKLDEINKQLECSTQELKQEKDLAIQLQQVLTEVKGELKVKEHAVQDAEERLNILQQSLQQQIDEAQIKLEKVNQQLECSAQELKQEKELTSTLQQSLTGLKCDLETKEQSIRETEERLNSLQNTLQQELTETKDKIDELTKQLQCCTQELTEEKETALKLQEKITEITVNYEEALSSIKTLESARKAESDQYAVEIHEQIEIVEALKVEKCDLSSQLESLLLEKKDVESSLKEELAKKDEAIRNNAAALVLCEKEISSLKNDLLVREADHKKKMEGLKQYLDSEKSSSLPVAASRKLSVQTPEISKKPVALPVPTTPTSTPISNLNEKSESTNQCNQRSILRRSCSGDTGRRFNGQVHFNHDVQVRKFNPAVFTVISSSDSEDSQPTRVIFKKQPATTNASAPPAKKLKSFADGDGPGSPIVLDKENTAGVEKATEKEAYSRTDNFSKELSNTENEPSKLSAPSPRKFFSKSRAVQSPLKSPFGCKSARPSKEKVSHNSTHAHPRAHGLHKGPGPQGHENSSSSYHSKSITNPAK